MPLTEHSRNLRLLLRGSSTSMLGSRLTAIAYPMLALHLTASPAEAGLVGFAAVAPSVLVYIPAGALVDRWNPRRVMLGCEFSRGSVIAILATYLILGRADVALLITVAIVEESLEVFSTLAERRCVRSLVEPCQVSSALVRTEATTHMVVLIGRPLGGFLFGIKQWLPFACDVLSFVASVIALLRIKATDKAHDLNSWNVLLMKPRAARDRQLVSEIREGILQLRADRFARSALALSASETLIAQALIIIFLAEAHARHSSSISVGVVLAWSGAGGTLGSMAGTRLISWCSRSWLKSLMWVWTVALGLLALLGPGSFVFLSVVIFAFGFTGAIGNIELNTYLMQKVDESLLARVLSIGTLMSFCALALGPVLGGELAQFNPADQGRSIIVLFVLVLGLALASKLLPGVDEPRTPTGAASGQSGSDPLPAAGQSGA